MSSLGAVSIWLVELQAGNDEAAQHLWEGYFPRLVGLARKRLRDQPRAVADEEDVALSAFASFCRAAEQQRCPRLVDRENLWHFLVKLTVRKACNLIRYQHTGKRDVGKVVPNESELAAIVGDEPTPEFAAQVADECRRLLDLLDDAELQAVAVARMEGCRNAEIATRLGVVESTVERRLKLIRKIWSESEKETA